MDGVAAGATVLTIAMLVVYLTIIRQQGNQPAAWFLALLVGAAAATGYATCSASPRRRAVLVLSGVVLTGAGLLAVLTIGLPILVSGVLCGVAAARSGEQRASGPSSTP